MTKPKEQPAQETEKENEIILTNEELQVGIPSPSRSLDWDLSLLDIQGNAIQDTRKEACDKFIEDEAFVQSQAFLQLVWKMKIDEYKRRCKERRAQKLNKTNQEN